MHRGWAAATGASATAAQTPAAAKSVVRERSLVRIVGLLNGPGESWLAAAVAAAAVGPSSTTHDQRGTIELVIPRIHISRFGRGGVDLDVAGRGAFGRPSRRYRSRRRRSVQDGNVEVSPGSATAAGAMRDCRCSACRSDQRGEVAQVPHRRVLLFKAPELSASVQPFSSDQGQVERGPDSRRGIDDRRDGVDDARRRGDQSGVVVIALAAAQADVQRIRRLAGHLDAVGAAFLGGLRPVRTQVVAQAG